MTDRKKLQNEIEGLRIAIQLFEPNKIDLFINRKRYDADYKKWSQMIDDYENKVKTLKNLSD